MNPFKKLASQTAIYGLPTIVGRLLNYFLVPLYTYNFSTTEYGTVNELYAYVSFLLIVLTYGMETALFNFSRQQEDKQRVYSTILTCIVLTSALFIAMLSLFSQPISDLIQYPDHPEYVTWFALILGMDAVSSIAFAKLREQNKARTFALIKSLNIFVNIFFNLFFLWLCKGAYDASTGAPDSWLASMYDPQVGIGYIFISNLIASGITLLVQLPSIAGTRLVFDRELFRKIFRYALPLLLAGLAGMTNETIDRILLKYLLPSELALHQVGVYGACYKISIIMTIFIQTFRYAAEPFFFSHAKEQEARGTYARVMNYFVIICMLIFLGTMANLDWIKYFVDTPYWEGLEVVPVLLLANFFLGVFFNLSIWYKLSGTTRYGAWLTIFGAMITLVGNFVFIPMYGFVASAWTTLVCYLLMMLASYVIGQKHYQVQYDLKRFVGYVLFAIVLYCLGEVFSVQLFNRMIETGNLAVNETIAWNLAFKNFLVLLFIIVAYLFEKRYIFKNSENQGHKPV